jgi:tRNA G18 (ribose-2'-O)-methylase SpoU
VVRRVLEFPSSHWARAGLRSVLVTQTALDALDPVVQAVPGDVPIVIADQAVMNRLAGFNIHRGCLALTERPARRGLEAADLAAARQVLVLEGVNNPDNVGGLFRSAAALGADLVVLGPSCGDPLYRKSIRTSMGATLALPFVDAGAWPEALARLRAAGFDVIAMTPAAGAVPLEDRQARRGRVAVLVGAEGDGLSVAALHAASTRVRIPMAPGVDSLNVTSAASIAMYSCFAHA